MLARRAAPTQGLSIKSSVGSIGETCDHALPQIIEMMCESTIVGRQGLCGNIEDAEFATRRSTDGAITDHHLREHRSVMFEPEH